MVLAYGCDMAMNASSSANLDAESTPDVERTESAAGAAVRPLPAVLTVYANHGHGARGPRGGKQRLEIVRKRLGHILFIINV